MTMTAATYAALLISDAAEGAAFDLAQGRYLHMKNTFPELDAKGVAELSLAMAFEKIAATFVPSNVVLDTLVAGQDLSAKQYHFVQMVAGDVFAAATAGQRGIIGVLQNAPNTAATCTIAGGGMTPVISGTALTKGAAIISDAAGKAITATAAVSNHIIGYALAAASGAGVQVNMAFGYQGPVTNAS